MIQRLNVPFEFPVLFTDDVFAASNGALSEVLPGPARVFLCLDENAAAAHPDLGERAADWCRQHALTPAAEPRRIPGGEAIKNDWAAVQALIAEMLQLRLDRHALVLVVGGGAVLDAVGFAASLVHRGLRTIRIPTTSLAQCDAGVGVKTAVNFAGGKNAIGTFAPPFAVVNDFQFLVPLPDREWRGGIAEAFKVGIIRDAAFFDELCANAAALRARTEEPMRRLVRRCAELHLEHIRAGGDPFEMGRARPLDFGHWAAHKLEILSGFAIAHGDAVAAGLALDSAYAAGQGWIGEADWRRIHAGLAAVGFPLWYAEMENPALLEGLRDFQEHLGGDLCVTFPDGLGARREENHVDPAAVRAALARLKAAAREAA